MAAITSAAIAVASSAYSIYSGIKQKHQAEKKLENIEVPELENPNKTMRVSTMGSDLIREEGQRRTANIIDGLEGGGARNMMSAIPKLVSMNDQINQKAMVNIDNQMLQREYAIASYEEKRNQYDENRYQNELAGIGAMYNSGQHQMWDGIRSLGASAGSMGRAIEYKKAIKGLDAKDKLNAFNAFYGGSNSIA